MLPGVGVEASCESLHEVRVRQEAAEPCLSVEAMDEFARVSQVVCKEFDCDRLPCLHVVAEKNGAHPTCTNAAKQAVSGDLPWVRFGGISSRGVASRHRVLRSFSPAKRDSVPIHP